MPNSFTPDTDMETLLHEGDELFFTGLVRTTTPSGTTEVELRSPPQFRGRTAGFTQPLPAGIRKSGNAVEGYVQPIRGGGLSILQMTPLGGIPENHPRQSGPRTSPNRQACILPLGSGLAVLVFVTVIIRWLGP